MNDPFDWPVLTTYDKDHLARIALPLGGIGTGTISLGGRGDLRDWEIVNRPAKGFTPSQCFFALFTQAEGESAVTRALEGPIPFEYYEGYEGSKASNHGLPRFRNARFEAAYPFGQVLLEDDDVPVSVRLQAFNPLIPADTDRSSLPFAMLRFVLTNKSQKRVKASVCGNMKNFIGMDGTDGVANKNRNVFKNTAGLSGLYLCSDGVDMQAAQCGTMALATPVTEGISYRTSWLDRSWGDSLLDFWDDFSSDGKLEDRESSARVNDPMASLAVSVDIPAGGEVSIPFLIAWHFPNRMSWTPYGKPTYALQGEDPREGPIIGNYYTNQFQDAWEAAEHAAASLPSLEHDTLEFVRAFNESDLPAVIKEAALYNLSTLRTQTCFRTPDGRFYGWEGIADRWGSCHGSCTHVWNYEQGTAFLFGELARSMREVEFGLATSDTGLMSFRVNLPIEYAQTFGLAAADGQMGCLLKLYRDWQLSGDDAMLADFWPAAKRALEFCWIPGGWDADKDGVMEGCQHNTMDVEYFGPNPQMGAWYLGALRAAQEMAKYLGDTDFASTCRSLFENGRAWIDSNLFNGEYYEHHVVTNMDAADIAPGLRIGMGTANIQNPELQLAKGCLVDQLVGQYMAHVCGLGYLLDPENVRTTLRSIMHYNYRETMHGHFNHMRSYAMGDELALLMAAYPHGRPERPFPYFNEVMTGYEYVAGIHMLYEDDLDSGLKVIRSIRDRYDGLKRSPFNEAECGHHYSRAMASWAGVLALTGFHYSAVTGKLQVAKSSMPATWFWSTGNAWGTITQNGAQGQLTVKSGALQLSRISIGDTVVVPEQTKRTLEQGETVVW